MEHFTNTSELYPNRCPECGHDLDLPPPDESSEVRSERMVNSMGERAVSRTTKLDQFRPVPGRPDIVAYRLHIPPTGRESTITKMVKEKLEAKAKLEAKSKKRARNPNGSSRAKA
jgi:hypothetical protein